MPFSVRMIGLSVLTGAIFAVSSTCAAQVGPHSVDSESFAAELERLRARPNCREAAESFQLLDKQIGPFLQEVAGGTSPGGQLNRLFRDKLNRMGPPWPAAGVRFVRFQDENNTEYFAAASTLSIGSPEAQTISSLRMLGRNSATGDYEVLATSDAALDLIERPLLHAPALKPCFLPIEVERWKSESGYVYFHGYYQMPRSGADLGGINWRFSPALRSLQAVKSDVFCSNFDCTEP